MDDGALNHTLKACRWLHINIAFEINNRCQLDFDELCQLFDQLININIAGMQHFKRVTVFGQRQQQMF